MVPGSSVQGLGVLPEPCPWKRGLGSLDWRRAWPTVPAPKGARTQEQSTAVGRQIFPCLSPVLGPVWSTGAYGSVPVLQQISS